MICLCKYRPGVWSTLQRDNKSQLYMDGINVRTKRNGKHTDTYQHNVHQITQTGSLDYLRYWITRYKMYEW